MALNGSIQAVLCCALVAASWGLPSGLLGYYPMMMSNPAAAALMRPGRDVPTYHDDAPIMPRHEAPVDLKAYESAVVELLAEVDKKDRKPHERGSESPMALAQLNHAPGGQVDVNVNVPYANVDVQTGVRKPAVAQETPTAQEPPSVFTDNNPHFVGVNVVKTYKPYNLGINIPGIFNLQIFRTPDGQRRIGIGVLPGWTNVQVGHTTPNKAVAVNVGSPVEVYKEAHTGYY